MQRRVPGVPVSDAEKAQLLTRPRATSRRPPPPATDKADRRSPLARCLPSLLSLRAVVAALLVWNMALHYALKDAHAQLAAAPACNASNASAAYALLEEELLHDSEESLSRFIAGATREEEGLPVLKDIPVPGESAPPPPPPPAAAARSVPARHPVCARRACRRLQSGRHEGSCESFCVAKFFRAHCSRCKCRGCGRAAAGAQRQRAGGAAAANATTVVAPPAVAGGANATTRPPPPPPSQQQRQLRRRRCNRERTAPPARPAARPRTAGQRDAGRRTARGSGGGGRASPVVPGGAMVPG